MWHVANKDEVRSNIRDFGQLINSLHRHLWHLTHEKEKVNKKLNSYFCLSSLIKYANKNIWCLNTIYIYIYIYVLLLIGIMVRVFANSLGDKPDFNPRSSYQKWYLMSPCLTHSALWDIIKAKWSNPGKEVVTSPTSWCHSYWKVSLQVVLEFGQPTNLLLHTQTHTHTHTHIYIYI